MTKLTHSQYTAAVEDKLYPEDCTVPLGSHFKDERGSIQNLIESAELNAVSIIYSKAGSVRSNHMHTTESHYLYVLSGKMEYFERLPRQDPDGVKPIIYRQGEMCFTKPGVIHMTKFVKDTILISLSPQSRLPHQHDEDLIKVDFFDKTK